MQRGRLALALLVLICGAAEAQQLDFKRVSRSGEERLAFHWRDAADREHLTAFTLTRRDIGDAESSFKEFSLGAMWGELETNLREETASFGNGARIEVKRQHDRLTWTVWARDAASQDALLKSLATRFDRAQKAYLARHLRQRMDDGRILVDFAAATKALQEPMRGVARALGGTPGIADDDRSRIALALAFFQQIPYVALGDGDARGNDFLPGPALLAQNRGDCDSKAVALAAVLRTYTPWRKLAVITMPGHATLGVDLPALAGEQTVRAQARQYVIMDVAGPYLSQIGNVDGRTAKYLADSRQIEIWPLN